MKKYSVVVPGEFQQVLVNHLLRDDGQEDLCFATYVPSTGNDRISAILTGVILPEEEERNIHGNVGYFPEYVERVMRIVRESGDGLVFLHSHPAPGWQSMSNDDILAEKRLSRSAYSSVGLPLLGMTLGNDESWSARFWMKNRKEKYIYECFWCYCSCGDIWNC